MDRIPYQELDSYPGEFDLTTRHDEPFTGIAYREPPESSVIQEWVFREGQLWGPQRCWWPDGRLADAHYCVAGVGHGASRHWYRDGRKSGVALLEYGVAVRRRSSDKDGRIYVDYLVQREPQAAAYLKWIEEGRRDYGALIATEPIPDDYLRIEEDEWRETCWRHSYQRAYVNDLDSPPGQQAITRLRGEPFTGVAIEVRGDGMVEREWILRDGLLWGAQRGWKNGMTQESAGYAVAGLKHGAWRQWNGREILSLEWHQFGILARAMQWNYAGAVTLDYQFESDPNAAELRREIEERRTRFSGIIETENIPEGFLQVNQREWDRQPLEE